MAALVEAAEDLSLHPKEAKLFRQAVRSFGGSLPGQDADSDSDPSNESCGGAAVRSEEARAKEPEAPTAASPASEAQVPSPYPSPHRSATPPTPKDRMPTPLLEEEPAAVPSTAATVAHASAEGEAEAEEEGERGGGRRFLHNWNCWRVGHLAGVVISARCAMSSRGVAPAALHPSRGRGRRGGRKAAQAEGWWKWRRKSLGGRGSRNQHSRAPRARAATCRRRCATARQARKR